ncbi:TIGR02391 family protein [Methylobacterium sp. yr668]|nr:TIGR02391 family protein [Methylobacterium sp. yr668]SFT26928.1 TIGR02391 family protein [Methylobacterium sp. yr668]
MAEKCFQQSDLEAIAAALGDTGDGLTGSDIGFLLRTCRMGDPTPALSKRYRLYNAFAEHQNRAQNRRAILQFIRQAMRPTRFARIPNAYEPLRANLNKALAFMGLFVNEEGELGPSERVHTLTEAQRRAQDLRADLVGRGVHPDVLAFCKAELLADNYFHAVLEATKSVADKLRARTGLTGDGALLVDQALGSNPPMLAINSLSTESERGEQRGFTNLVRGVFGMFRNVTAHEARVRWSMQKADAEDLLTLVSLIHRRLDSSHMPPRV